MIAKLPHHLVINRHGIYYLRITIDGKERRKSLKTRDPLLARAASHRLSARLLAMTNEDKKIKWATPEEVLAEENFNAAIKKHELQQKALARIQALKDQQTEEEYFQLLLKQEAKEDLLKHEAFTIIVNLIIEWYDERYGSLANKKEKDSLRGLAKFLNEYILLEIPKTLSKVEVHNETSWLIFPNEMNELESFRDFFKEELPFDNLSDNENAEIHTHIIQIVKCSRSINLDLNTSSSLSKDGYAMRSTIWAHVESAITNIQTQKIENCSVAGWELFLAVEKMLKIYLSQFGDFKNTHNIKELVNEANNYGLNINLKHVEDGLLNFTYHEFIKMRYAEFKIDINTAYSLYKNSLEILLSISEKLKKEFEMKNSAFLIKKAPWAR